MTDYTELITSLREEAEWAEANEWETPIMLSDHLKQAADAIEGLSDKATPRRVGFSGWKGCRDTRYKCPYCNKYVRNDDKYCHKCGQALLFPNISHTPYIPGEKQEVIVTWPDEPPKEGN